jgi:hypothetical protein
MTGNVFCAPVADHAIVALPPGVNASAMRFSGRSIALPGSSVCATEKRRPPCLLRV